MNKIITLIKETASDVYRVFTIGDGIKKFFGVSLYRNAVYLMLDAVIPAVAGFMFWVVAARLYSTENIGIASAAISAIGFLVAFSTLGLNNTLIRFLPGAGEHSEEMINTSFTIGGMVAVAAAFIFILGLDLWSPALISIRNNPVFFIMFIVFVPVNLFDSLTGAIFVAQRRSGLMLWQDMIISVLRFIPLFLLTAFFTNYVIFASWGLAILIAVVIGLLIFIPIIHRGYRLRLTINTKIFGKMVQFSAANYLVNLLSMAFGSILPLMVLNTLGAEKNAYFYISWTISSTIAAMPSAITTALFAEGAYDEKTLLDHVKRSIIFISLLLIPLVIIILIISKWLLLMFGTKYSQMPVPLLQILTISALPLSINSVYFTIKIIQKTMKSVIIMTGCRSAIALIISYVLLPRIGLLGVGIGWLSANIATAFFIIISWIRNKSLL